MKKFARAIKRLRGAWKEHLNLVMGLGVVDGLTTEQNCYSTKDNVSSMGKCVYDEARDRLGDIKEGLEEEQCNQEVMTEALPFKFDKVNIEDEISHNIAQSGLYMKEQDSEGNRLGSVRSKPGMEQLLKEYYVVGKRTVDMVEDVYMLDTGEKIFDANIYGMNDGGFIVMGLEEEDLLAEDVERGVLVDLQEDTSRNSQAIFCHFTEEQITKEASSGEITVLIVAAEFKIKQFVEVGDAELGLRGADVTPVVGSFIESLIIDERTGVRQCYLQNTPPGDSSLQVGKEVIIMAISDRLLELDSVVPSAECTGDSMLATGVVIKQPERMFSLQDFKLCYMGDGASCTVMGKEISNFVEKPNLEVEKSVAGKYSMSGDEICFDIGVVSGAAEILVKPEGSSPGFEAERFRETVNVGVTDYVDVELGLTRLYCEENLLAAAKSLFYVEEEGKKYLQQEMAIGMARRAMEEYAQDFSYGGLYSYHHCELGLSTSLVDDQKVEYKDMYNYMHNMINMNTGIAICDEELFECSFSMCDAIATGAAEHITDCDDAWKDVDEEEQLNTGCFMSVEHEMVADVTNPTDQVMRGRKEDRLSDTMASSLSNKEYAGVVEYSTDHAYNPEIPARNRTLLEKKNESVADLDRLPRYASKCGDEALAALGCSWIQEDDPKGLPGETSLYTTEEVKNIKNNPVIMSDLKSSLLEIQRQLSSTVLTGDQHEGLDGNTELSWEDFPYRDLTWTEVEHDLAQAECVAARERVMQACKEASTELKHIDIEKERREMIKGLDQLVDQYVCAYSEYDGCHIRLVGEHLAGQEEDMLWQCIDVVEEVKEIIREPSNTSGVLTGYTMSNKSRAMDEEKTSYHKWPDITVNIGLKTANQFPKMPPILARPPPIRSLDTSPTSSPVPQGPLLAAQEHHSYLQGVPGDVLLIQTCWVRGQGQGRG